MNGHPALATYVGGELVWLDTVEIADGWSAAGAALARGEADLRITLVAPDEHLVLRPRLYEPEPDLAKVELSRILEPIGVEHLRARVSRIDTDRHVVVADGQEVGYDRLVLAAGSELVRPQDLPGAERLFDIDTLAGARRLTGLLRDREDYSAVVVGAGKILAAAGRVSVELPFTPAGPGTIRSSMWNAPPLARSSSVSVPLSGASGRTGEHVRGDRRGDVLVDQRQRRRQTAVRWRCAPSGVHHHGRGRARGSSATWRTFPATWRVRHAAYDGPPLTPGGATCDERPRP
ncbi:FAD-dependent oxidoreductase [Nonomuraea sp. NPDC050691]|uniref:FAD-dependent oxidoreductase n=1 Tax=Nonomuraea sp. NPDC050691 TaxID=3155661 RepID=UPI0033E1EEA3